MKFSNTTQTGLATMAPTRFAMLAGCLLALPLTLAGTPTSPDLTDAQGDIQIAPSGLLANIAAPEHDILSVWVTTTPTNVETTIQVLDLSHRVREDEVIFFTLGFQSAEYRRAQIDAQYALGSWDFFFSGTRHDDSSFITFINGSADLATNRLSMTVPRSLLNATMVDAKASSILVVPHPLGSLGGGPAWYRDWAPDEGPGATIPIV